MSDSTTEGSEARVAMYFVTIGIIGSIIMALASNFLK
jgi:hypothetical protein